MPASDSDLQSHRANGRKLWKKCLSILKPWNQRQLAELFSMKSKTPIQEQVLRRIAANYIEQFWNNGQRAGKGF